jgi:hypothetical protein
MLHLLPPLPPLPPPSTPVPATRHAHTTFYPPPPLFVDQSEESIKTALDAPGKINQSGACEDILPPFSMLLTNQKSLFERLWTTLEKSGPIWCLREISLTHFHHLRLAPCAHGPGYKFEPRLTTTNSCNSNTQLFTSLRSLQSR